jgi:phage regulator Rha-like protein
MAEKSIIPDDIIMNKIYYIRNQKVMLDSDLADLYQVETKRLKEQVKRNISRFPERFMFELTKQENDLLRSQNATLEKGAHSKYLPFVFTEHGILMLANVLKSKSAVEVSIRIIDIFVKLRENLADQKELWLQIEKIKNKLDNQDKNMEIVFRYLDELIERKAKPEPRKRIGYKSDNL